MRSVAGFHIVLGFILIVTLPPYASAESTSIQAVRGLAGTASRPYAVVVDANTLEHPEWSQVVEALKKKYNAKVFVAHYPELRKVRKALNEYMPWYVCFVAQPEQATREMITAAAHTMTWLDDDPYEDAIWAVLTGFVAEDALRIVNAEPFVVRKILSHYNGDWLDWFEVGISINSAPWVNKKFIKNSDGVKQQFEIPKDTTQEFVDVLNQDDCDIIMTNGHGSEHAFYLGDTTSDGYITHNAIGDIHGVDTLGKVHRVNAKQLKIHYSPANCLIGHIDGKSCYSLAWIHNGVNAFWGRLYSPERDHVYSIGEYFMALQGRYTFAEATYANWLMSRFSEDKLRELQPWWDIIEKSNVLYGDPAWEARVKHSTVPAYTQDLNIEHLSDGLIKMTASFTVSQKFHAWMPSVRPVVLLPFRIQEAQVKHTDLEKMDVADNFIVLDLGTRSIGGPELPVGTKKSVVLHARKLEVWSFLSDDEVVTRMREWELDNFSWCIDFLTDETVDPNERIKKAAKWGMLQNLAKEADVNAKDENGRTPLHFAVESAKNVIIEVLLDKGANINAKDKDGRTPLHLAAESADEDMIELLLDKGANINVKDDKSGFTALHHAVRLGKKNVVELLIAKGADINARDKQGHTPLYIAANHDHKIAEFLLSKGADSSIRIESGQTLLQLVQKRKQIESKSPDMIFDDGAPNSLFGITPVCGDVDGDGYDDILIGAGSYDNKRGRVYLFYGGPDMDATSDLVFEGQHEGDKFGLHTSCGDIDNDGYDDIVITASGYENRTGRAYLYWGSDRHSMDADPDKIFVGEQEPGALFGSGYPAIYDIDNDGYDDIVLGAFYASDRTGRAYLYYGNAKELMDASLDLIFTGENPGDKFGLTTSCGDIDNDGYGDIVIRPASKGRAYLYYGSSKSNMKAKADHIIEVEATYTYEDLVCVDLNRDGCDDIVVGDLYHNGRQGRACLFHGNSKRRLNADPDIVFEGEVERSDYGSIVCGDIDGDNTSDLIIGARNFREGAGRVYVYWGSELDDPNPKPGRIFTGDNPNAGFGYGLACGDVNSDGFDDLVIGTGTKSGRAYLYYGGPKKN
ncbi:ankyrin repeat domain-containing protein [Planctomycetota bacterium]